MIDGVSGPQGPTYEAGQRVSILGAEGVIDRIYDKTNWMFPLWGMEVLLDSGRRIMLTPEGMPWPECRESVLKVIGTAKRKVKKWRWIEMINGELQITMFHYSEDFASKNTQMIQKVESSEITEEE